MSLRLTMALCALAALVACDRRGSPPSAAKAAPPGLPPSEGAGGGVDAGAAAAPRPAGFGSARETELFGLDPRGRVSAQLVSSADGRRFALGVEVGEVKMVVVDGTGTRYGDWVADKSLAFDPSGKHVVWVAKAGAEAQVWLDGSIALRAEGIGAGTVSVDAEGTLAAALMNGGRWTVRVGGREAGPYDEVMAGTPVLAAGGRAGWVGREGAKWRVVIDGLPDRLVDGAGPPVFSKDGKRVAVVVQEGGQLRAVVDGKPGPLTPSFGPEGVIFSPDGKQSAWVVNRGADRFELWRDGKPTGRTDAVGGSLTFSPDGKRLAWVADQGKGRQRVVIDDEDQPEHDGIGGALTWSADGKRLAYAARDGASWQVVVDGQGGAAFDKVDVITFSPDGAHVAYAAAKAAAWRVVRDGVPGEAVAGVGWLVFSADGEHLAAMVQTRAGMQVSLDGLLGPVYLGLVGKGYFDEGTLGYLAVSASAILRVEQVVAR